MQRKIHSTFKSGRDCVLYNGDCFKLLKQLPDNYVQLTVSSPPYCMGKEYEDSRDVDDFVEHHERILSDLYRITAPGGSICWQVGYHVNKGLVTPLDYLVLKVFSAQKDLYLRNRIIWAFGHGLHGTKRFSGRHEILLWFTKGDQYKFDLDAVRVPQKYPGKRYYKGDKRGEPSSNPLGKNPGDVWEIPVVSANHVEKTAHPCQFPQALAQRLILGLSDQGDVVFDPFVGSGTTGAAAIAEKRRFVGSEIRKDYSEIARKRILSNFEGLANYRPIDKPLQEPNPNHKVSRPV